jgi:Bacterial Ig-like domain (group 3)/FG-GAP-like repeat/FG-GAP repeat
VQYASAPHCQRSYKEIKMLCKSAASRLVCLAFLLSLLPIDMNASALFKPALTNLSGGVDAFSVAVADVNGDGKLDVVVSNAFACDTGCTNGSVGILLGNGDGTFQAARTYDSGGSGAGGIAVADVNGDGKPDVVVTNVCAGGPYCEFSNTGSVAVLLGNGDGTFNPARVFSTGNQISRYLALGDFNADGKLDVAVADGCGGCGNRNIVIMLGRGDGTFQSPQTYDLPNEPQGITVGDIKGDGRLDIVVGLEQNGTSAVLFGNGDGTFSAPETLYPAGAYPVLADINGDGMPDLVVATPCSNPYCTKGGVGVLLGNGDGTFQALQNYNSGGSGADFVTVGDLNRDGKLDVFVANYSGKVGTLLGAGDGILSPVQLSNPGVGGPFSMAIGDVNGDGKPDLVVAIYFLNNDSSTGGVGVLLNNTFWTTTTALTSNPNPSVQGERVTLTATVTTEGSIAPTGKVVFKNGSTSIGNATLIGGVATLAKTNLPIGTLSLTAKYQGDINSAKSTSPVLIQVVNP